MKISTKPNGAFTLVELLVIIAMVGIFVVLLAPALAGTKDHAQRALCANNLRELGLGTAVYAEHYNGAYPITQAGANPVNYVRGGYYTRWVFYDGSRPGFHLSQTWDGGTWPDYPGTTGTFWRNLGMLYPERLAGDGSMFYCPGLNAKKPISAESANSYQPLLTTDYVGSIRSSYIYNPWVDGNYNRLYAKTSSVIGRKVFGLDYMDRYIWNSDGTVNTENINFGHSQARGWNVLFSDNSVDFKRVDKRVSNTVAANNTAFDIPFGMGYDIQGIDLLCAIFEK